MFGAIGIGALIGALGAKQRGGNLLKGALGGAALGGIGGMLGAKYGGGAGGLFGFGTKMLPNAAALAGIGMGTEMLGQQEANQAALAGRRRMMDEEEERRIARLSKIAGYDVADSKNFLTPQSYFGTTAARGGAIRRKYEMGGGVDNSGIMSVAENKPHPLTAFKDLYDRYITEGVPIAGEQEPLSFKDFFEIIQTKIPKAARGGRVHAAAGMYLGDDGMYDKFLDNPMLMQNKESMMLADDYNSMEIDEDAQENYLKGIMNAKPAMRGTTGMDEDGFVMVPGPDGEMMKVKPAMRGFNTGGIADLDMRSGGESMGPGTGTSDDVPAMLSDGEFVVTAKAVENLGGGDRMMGAKRMYQMMNTLDPNSQKPGEMNYVGHG